MSNLSSRIQPKRNRGALSADRIFNSTSPIVKADIQTFLSICVSNWQNYDEEEKSSIISSLPSTYRKYEVDTQGILLCPLTFEFVAKDRVIRNNVAAFKREVNDGYYTRTWQEKARKATQERAEGQFDAYLKSHAEEMFGNNAENEMDDEESMSSDGDYGKRKSKSGKKGKGAKQGKETANDRSGNKISAEVEAEYSSAMLEV